MKRIYVFLLALCIMMTATLVGCGTTTTVISNFGEDEYVGGEDVISEDVISDVSDAENSSSKDEASTGNNNNSSKVDNITNPNANTTEEYNPYSNMTNTDKKATVRIMTHWALSDAEQSILDDFTDKYGTKIKVINVTKTLYQSKLASMVASGDAPDLCEMDASDFPTSIINDLVEPISKGAAFNIEKDPELDIRQMDAFKWKGQYYGVNLRNNMTYQRYCIYYNETMFNNRGVKTPYKYWKEGKWNWDTFAELAKKMTYEKNGTKVYGYSGEDTEQQGFLLAAGVDFVTNNNGKITNNLKNSKLIKVLQGISELRANGYWNPEDKGTGPFMQGLTAMCGSRTWLMEKNQDFTTKMTDKWGAVPMPSPAGQEEIVGINPTMWCIAKGAKNPNAASYVLRYWLDYDNWNINDVIVDKQLLEIFNYMNETNNAMATVSQGVTGYDDDAQYYKLLYTTRNNKNDIPVALEKVVPTIDGIIERISK